MHLICQNACDYPWREPNSHDCSSLKNQQNPHRRMCPVTFNTKVKGEIAFWAKTCTHRRKPRAKSKSLRSGREIWAFFIAGGESSRHSLKWHGGSHLRPQQAHAAQSQRLGSDWAAANAPVCLCFPRLSHWQWLLSKDYDLRSII